MGRLRTDPAFDINRTEEYKLSIQVSLDGFSFSVIHPAKKRLLALQCSPVMVSSENLLGRRFKEWFEHEELFQKKFTETRLLYSSTNTTLVPAPYYDYEKQNELAGLVFGNLGTKTTRDNYWPSVEGNLVFTIPESLQEIFDQKLPGNLIVHPLSVYNKRILQKKNSGDILVTAYFEKSWFSLMLYKNEQLQLINSFKTNHPTDILFYMMSVLKQQKINPQVTRLLLAGDISQEGDIYNNFIPWFEGIDFFEPEISYNQEVFNDSLHRYIPLL